MHGQLHLVIDILHSGQEIALLMASCRFCSNSLGMFSKDAVYSVKADDYLTHLSIQIEV